MGLPRPNYAMSGEEHAMSVEYYRGWTGAIIGLSAPVPGTQLSNVETANAYCQKALGAGYRMAEFHDGKWISGMGDTKYFGDIWPNSSMLSSGGWTWYGQGNVNAQAL